MQGQGKKQSVWSYSCRVNKPSPRAHPAKLSLLLDETQGDGAGEWAETKGMRCMLFIIMYVCVKTHFASVIFVCFLICYITILLCAYIYIHFIE